MIISIFFSLLLYFIFRK
ncbi:MAG: hypothetical protein NC820_03125 [Candidatus Omnitrophica bacterium]|nr:hypothetical protein [Candidatus Omnitrophota bacterium]